MELALPPKEQRDALKNPLNARSDVPPPSKGDRAAAHKRRYEDQERLNYFHKRMPPAQGQEKLRVSLGVSSVLLQRCRCV